MQGSFKELSFMKWIILFAETYREYENRHKNVGIGKYPDIFFEKFYMSPSCKVAFLYYT